MALLTCKQQKDKARSIQLFEKLYLPNMPASAVHIVPAFDRLINPCPGYGWGAYDVRTKLGTQNAD